MSDTPANIRISVHIDLGTHFGMSASNTIPDTRARPYAAPVHSARSRRGRGRPMSVSPEPPLVNGTRPGTRLVRRGAKWTPRVTRSSLPVDGPIDNSDLYSPTPNGVKIARTRQPVRPTRSSASLAALNDGSSSDSSTTCEATYDSRDSRTEANLPPGSAVSADGMNISGLSVASMPSPGRQVDDTVAASPPRPNWEDEELNEAFEDGLLEAQNSPSPGNAYVSHGGNPNRHTLAGHTVPFPISEKDRIEGLIRGAERRIQWAIASLRSYSPTVNRRLPKATSAGPSTWASLTKTTATQKNKKIEVIELSSDDDD